MKSKKNQFSVFKHVENNFIFSDYGIKTKNELIKILFLFLKSLRNYCELTNIIIPNSVIEIGDFAFANYNNFTYIQKH